MSNKYSQISNLEELEAAHKRLKQRISRKEKEVSHRLNGLKDDYSASNLLGMTLRSTETDRPILQLVRFLRKKIADL